MAQHSLKQRIQKDKLLQHSYFYHMDNLTQSLKRVRNGDTAAITGAWGWWREAASCAVARPRRRLPITSERENCWLNMKTCAWQKSENKGLARSDDTLLVRPNQIVFFFFFLYLFFVFFWTEDVGAGLEIGGGGGLAAKYAQGNTGNEALPASLLEGRQTDWLTDRSAEAECKDRTYLRAGLWVHAGLGQGSRGKSQRQRDKRQPTGVTAVLRTLLEMVRKYSVC